MNAVAVAIIILLTVAVCIMVVVSGVYIHTMLKIVEFINYLEKFIIDS